MRRSRFLLKTLKEVPKDAVVISHILMLRSGMIRQVAAGIYNFLPLGLRSIRKIEKILREELDKAGCQELLMPMVLPAELWIESGRWKNYGKELLRFKDRKDNEYCLGPTHEEVITDIVRREVRSYKDLPLNLYQIQSKFRDEIRPRFGLMRGREFIMKDGYSFDLDEAKCDQTYWTMYEAYKRIFSRCGLTFRPVQADSGAIGGSYTHEFHVLADSGEDEILTCGEYAANVERCELRTVTPLSLDSAAVAAPELVATPGQKTIEAVSSFLSVSAASILKTLVFRADDRYVGAVVCGDRELNEAALIRELNAGLLELVTQPEIFEELGLHPGYLGPVGWPNTLPLFVDDAVMGLSEAVTGANQPDAHLKGVVPVAHIKPAKVLTLRRARAGDACPACEGGVLESFRGIEVGQVFKLGTKYSQSMNAVYLDTEGKEQVMVMGCYGIGVGRTMAAAIEQNYDKDGIIWPVQIAPFHVSLLNLDPDDEQVTLAVDTLYAALGAAGVEVLLDDTPQRPGFKFKDSDLIGLPLALIVGARSLLEGQVEIKHRRGGQRRTVALGAAVDEIVTELKLMGWETC